ncbi:putative armadillo-like helical protein [Lupinus albus]|uniref:Putative armadillo-like helical protein n=1 Tax=Lupinus albus TaxID=3870 RepID=A0A6A4N293_LUPAL|nr:putative armadillo-like helical protein [Lupinus albus]
MYTSIDSCHDLDENDDVPFLHPSQPPCSQGHRSSFNLETHDGGSICLHCFSNLISNPLSPTLHVSYALSQLSRSLSHSSFLQSLFTFHPHFLVSPLLSALSCFDDEPIAVQVVDLVRILSHSAPNDSVSHEFLDRVSALISSAHLAWSSRQLHMVYIYI